MAGLRLAGLIVGITVASGWLLQRVELLYNGPHLAGAGSTPGAQVFLAVPLGALAAATLMRRLLGPGDRAVLYAALAIGVSATASGLMHRFLPGLVTGFYGGFALPTGPYYRFLQVVPDWLVPSGPNEAPAIGRLKVARPCPGGAWLWPLAMWTVFFGAFFLTCFCLVWLLRQRWLETERLGFPLLEVPRALIAGDLFGQRLFWWGALVPVALLGINGWHHYAPKVPEIAGLDMAHFLLDDRGKPWRPLSRRSASTFVPLLVGAAFLAPVEVSFSTWVFYLLTRVQLLVAHFLGRLEYRGDFIPGHGSPWLDWPSHFPFFMSQARGGLLFLGLFSLWSARRALAAAISWRSRGDVGLVVGAAGAMGVDYGFGNTAAYGHRGVVASVAVGVDVCAAADRRGPAHCGDAADRGLPVLRSVGDRGRAFCRCDLHGLWLFGGVWLYDDWALARLTI